MEDKIKRISEKLKAIMEEENLYDPNPEVNYIFLLLDYGDVAKGYNAAGGDIRSLVGGIEHILEELLHKAKPKQKKFIAIKMMISLYEMIEKDKELKSFIEFARDTKSETTNQGIDNVETIGKKYKEFKNTRRGS